MSCCCSGESPLEPRRGFIAKMIAWCCGAAAFLVPTGAGLFAFLNPLRQKPTTGDFVRVATFDSLDETPRKVAIQGDRVDAWTKEIDVPIGAIYVRKTADGEVEALQASCPHAGCIVSAQTVQDEDGKPVVQFYCPCHQAYFDITGAQLPKSTMSPRDLDTLEVKREGDEVLVRYQTFRAGTSSKIADA